MHTSVRIVILAGLLLGTARCLTSQTSPRPMYDGGAASLPDSSFACHVSRWDSEDEVATAEIRAGIAAAGIRCDSSSPRSLVVSVREVDRGGPVSLASSCIGIGTLTILPAYNGRRELLFQATVHLQDGEQHRFRYTAMQTRFSWLLFMVATGNPIAYEKGKLKQFVNDSAVLLLNDMHRASSLPSDRRFNKTVRLRDGRWFFNVRANKRADGLELELPDRRTVNVADGDVLGVKSPR